MHILQTILDALNWAAVHVPWAAVGASGIISPFLVGIKKWFSVQSERVMITLVAFVSTAAVAVNYLLHTPSHDPTIIAIQGAVVAFMTQPVYFFIVKPLFGWFGDQMAKAKAFDEQIKSAAVVAPPIPVVPVATPPITPTDDFSM